MFVAIIEAEINGQSENRKNIMKDRMKSRINNLEIYRMPDGKDYFAAAGQKGSYFLYPIEGVSETAVYEITSDGQIAHRQTKEVCYSINDLKETGLKFAGGAPEATANRHFHKETLTQTLFQMMLNDFYYGEEKTFNKN